MQFLTLDGIQLHRPIFNFHLSRVVCNMSFCSISRYLWMEVLELRYVDVCGTKQFCIESMNGTFSYLSISIFNFLYPILDQTIIQSHYAVLDTPLYVTRTRIPGLYSRTLIMRGASVFSEIRKKHFSFLERCGSKNVSLSLLL